MSDNLEIPNSSVERPAWINNLEQKLNAVNWPKMIRGLGEEGFPSACDVVGMRIARKLQDENKTVEPVQVVLPGDTEIVTNDQAHVAFIIGDDGKRYLFDFTYAYYVPPKNVALSRTTKQKPYIIVLFEDKIPEIGGKSIYRTMSLSEGNIFLASGMKRGDIMVDFVDSIIDSYRKSWNETVRKDGLDIYGGLDGYMRNVIGLDTKKYANIVTPRHEASMNTANLIMRQCLKVGDVDNRLFHQRWIAPVQSVELNGLLDQI